MKNPCTCNPTTMRAVNYDGVELVHQGSCDTHKPYVEPRKSWEEYFLEIATQVATRGTCDRKHVGAVIVRDLNILATGYNGSIRGTPHCDDVGHMMKSVIDDDGTTRQHCVRSVHAEQNAICQAAKHGISLEGSTLYCRMEPCRVCAMLIISCGVDRVVAKKLYHAAQETREMFKLAGIELEVIDDQTESYRQQ